MLETCWNRGLTHDLLEEIGEVEEVVLAHPLKTRLIVDAQIKTDRLDALGLGTLLRGAWWRAPGNPRARKPARARTCCVSGSIVRGCARCCAIASTRCWTDSGDWNCRCLRTSLARKGSAFCANLRFAGARGHAPAHVTT